MKRLSHNASLLITLGSKFAAPSRYQVAVYEPTHPQTCCGNYPKLHVKAHGLEFSVENPMRSKRYWGPDKKNFTVMTADYGYIRRTVGRDGDQIDVFLSPRFRQAKTVHVVDQLDKDGKFDEHKCLIGYDTTDEAKKAYLSNYTPGWTGCGAITTMPVADFKHWLRHGDASKPVSPVMRVSGKLNTKETSK